MKNIPNRSIADSYNEYSLTGLRKAKKMNIEKQIQLFRLLVKLKKKIDEKLMAQKTEALK